MTAMAKTASVRSALLWSRNIPSSRCCVGSSTRNVRNLLIRRDHGRRWYTLALTRHVSPQLANAISMTINTTATTTNAPQQDDNNKISLLKAQDQHAAYIEALKAIVPSVQELPALFNHPDCCFVEDTVVVIGRRALLMRMGHESRIQEVDSMAQVLVNIPGLKSIVDMRTFSSSEPTLATCDGGDVLYTGRHVFVGISDRTNMEGVRVLQSVFDDKEVVPVPVPTGILHLKSCITHMDSYTLVAPTGPVGDAVLKDMHAAERGYEVVRLPNVLACNVVSVNGTVLAQDVDCDESKGLLKEAAEENNLRIEFIDTSELAKVDAALTCCSVLLDV